MSEPVKTLSALDAELTLEMGGFFGDPMGWVMYAFPWDTDPSLQLVELAEPWATKYGLRYGPDKWACEFLEDWGAEIRKNGFDGKTPVPAIQMAVSSGHGIGKSTLTSWIILYIMSTRPYCKGTVTANTAEQLSAKTWSELGKWWKKCVTRHWFEYTNGKGNMMLYRVDEKESWFCKGTTCREENSESFAGQHAANSTSFYLFDEASAIPDIIHEVAEGGLTDGEPMWFMFGNPTRNSGRFAKSFKALRHRWKTYRIDSRSVAITNKEKLEEWRTDYGEDSDFFKVRVKGEFPSIGDMQFIGEADVDNAVAMEARSDIHNPLIMGVDVAAAENSDQFVLYFRKGLDGRSIPPLKFRNDGTDPSFTMTICGHIAQHAAGSDHTHREEVDAIFVDVGGMGWPIVHELRRLGLSPTPVNFGGKSTGEKQYANKSAQMWGNMRDWLRQGGAIVDDKELRDDLTGRMYGYDKDNCYMMEKKKDMKARGLASPDTADALALTFAYRVGPKTAGIASASGMGNSQPAPEFDAFS